MHNAPVAVLTGAAGLVGSATARLFARRDYRLMLADIDASSLARLREDLGGGDDVVTAVVDITRRADVQKLADMTIAQFGAVDLLANIAGIWPRSALTDTSDETWDQVLAVNLTAPFYCCRAFLPLMMTQGSGAIVNVASGAASQPHRGLGAYCASKSGLVGLSRVLALEGSPNVRVNVVAPGRIARPPELQATAAPRPYAEIPIRREAEPEEIALTIGFLASADASYITGQTLHVNGGRFMP